MGRSTVRFLVLPFVLRDVFTPTLLPENFLHTFSYSAAPNAAVIDLFVVVMPEWFKELTLTWQVPPSWATKAPRFNVYRSEIEHSGYLKLNNVPLLSPQFLDKSTTESSKDAQEFYMVEAVLNDGSLWRTAPAFVGDRLPRWHSIRLKEIQRREHILLRKFAGLPALVLRRVKYGAPCPECYDKLSQKLLKDHCTTCYGTGVEGGYYEGYRQFIQFDASTNSATYTYFGKFEQNQIGAWTIKEPNLEVFDVIIRLKDQKVFRVKDINNTEVLATQSRQIMRLEEQSKDDVLYKLLQREDVYSVFPQVNGVLL